MSAKRSQPGARGSAKSNPDSEEEEGVLANSTLQPQDILLGRGKGIQFYPGNVAFRRLVDSRKAEYDAPGSGNYGEKVALAESVYETITSPPDGSRGGRFMKAAESDEEVQEELRNNRPVCFHKDKQYYVEASRQVAIAKCKMTLRQKDKSAEQREARRRKRLERDGADAAAPAPSSSTAGTSDIDPIPDEDGSAALPDPLVSAAILAHLYADIDDSELPSGLNSLAAQLDLDEFEPRPLASIESASQSSQEYNDSHTTTSTSAMASFAESYHAADASHGNFQGKQTVLMSLNKAFTAISEFEERLGRERFDDMKIRELGRIIYSVFHTVQQDASGDPTSGLSNCDDGIVENQKSRRKAQRKTGNKSGYVSLVELGYPAQLSRLVDCLVNHSSDEWCYYTNVSEVEADLHLLASDSNTLLYDRTDTLSQGRKVHLSQGKLKLYGRSEELAALVAAYEIVVKDKKEKSRFTTVSGYTGSGKTAIVDFMRQRAKDDGLITISCIFSADRDEIQPLSLVCRAIDSFLLNLSESHDPVFLKAITASLQGRFESFARALAHRMPSLSRFLSTKTPFTTEKGNNDSTNCVIFCILNIIRAISAAGRPVVLIFDNVQWADQSCTDLIKYLVRDPDLSSLFCLASYRDEAVDHDHPLAECFGEIAMDSLAPMTTISLRNLTQDIINEWLSDILALLPRLCRPLAKEIHTKTAGNPMFVCQLLNALADEGLLRFSAIHRSWEWDIRAIRAKQIADNSVDLIISMMQAYDDSLRKVLVVAGLLGGSFDPKLLELALSADDKSYMHLEVPSVVNAAFSCGLFVQDGAHLHFSHDQIRQGAYSLTAVSARVQAHLDLGRRLMSVMGQGNKLDTSFLAIVVNQYNKGSDFIEEHEEKLHLSTLNLKAGQSAMDATDFKQANIYLRKASALIEQSDWLNNYKLCLDIYTALGEVELTQGNNDEAIASAAHVLTHGQCLGDKLRSHHTMSVAMQAKVETIKALDHGLSVLEDLGEPFPKQIEPDIIKDRFRQVGVLLQGETIDSITNKKVMVDEEKIELMRFLLNVSRLAYNSNPNMMLLIIMRMVEISMTTGISSEASFAFAALAAATCGMGNHDLSHFCSRIALSLTYKFNQEHSQIVLVLLNSSILPYRSPMNACVDSLRKAYNDGMACGDVNWGLLALSRCANMRLFALERAATLKDMKIEMKACVDTMELFKRNHFAQFSFHTLGAVYSLMSTRADNDPTTIPEKYTIQDDVLVGYPERVRSTILRKQFFICIWLAYLYREYDKAATFVQDLQDIAKSNPFHPSSDVISEQFYVGLLSAVMQRSQHIGPDEQARWKSLSMNIIERFRKWLEDGSEWNFDQKYHLLFAEQYYSDNVVDSTSSEAVEAYERAIEKSKKHCYIQEEALACERLGIFYMERRNPVSARLYLDSSKELYRNWGAERKAIDVELLITKL